MTQIRKFREGRNRDGLLDLIAALPLRSAKMAEIGSYAGEGAELFRQSGKFETIYCIDEWNSRDSDQVSAAFLNRVGGSENKDVCRIKASSRLAAGQFLSNSLDFVYIDANHKYESVNEDILLWLPKVSNGGWIGGHDYCWKFRGVIQAVHENFGIPYRVFQDSSWLIPVIR